MSNIVINGATYKDVPSIQVPNENGEMVEFEETSDIDKIINRTITSYSNDRITQVGACAFQYCQALKFVKIPNAVECGIYAFSNDEALININAPNVILFGNYSFYHCILLRVEEFPNLKTLGYYSFYECVSLTKLRAHKLVSIGTGSFASTGLKILIIGNNTICALNNTNAFLSTPIASGTGYIYVPKSLVDSYKSATNWSVYANQFRALEDYTVDGTITGELDESKI